MATQETRVERIADADCGMNTQAALLLHALSREDVELPWRVSLSTHPYCNCREMGFVLSIRGPNREPPRQPGEPLGKMKFTPPTNIAFFTHRNSDSLCAIRWDGNLPISGAVTPSDIPSEVYPDKYSVTKSWPYLDLRSAIEYAREVIGEVCSLAKASAA